jgi:hypothetical protein
MSIGELTRSSSFVFTGTVVEVGRSNVRALESHANLVLVRVHRGLRVDPALGDVRGRVVTVETSTPEELSPGFQAVFFTQAWIHGDELAVREVAHVDVGLADEVAQAVEALPDLHLADRLAAAAAVVHASVRSTRRIPDLPLERRAPRWAEARLEIISTLKGDASGKRLLFPTSDSHHWFLAPRFRRGQRGVFLLHTDDEHAGRWIVTAEQGDVVTALDPADVQPESQLGRVRGLIRTGP